MNQNNDGINADPIELEKFSQLAHRWWDPNSEFKPLHEINPLRLNYIDELTEGWKEKLCWMSGVVVGFYLKAWPPEVLK